MTWKLENAKIASAVFNSNGFIIAGDLNEHHTLLPYTRTLLSKGE